MKIVITWKHKIAHNPQPQFRLVVRPDEKGCPSTMEVRDEDALGGMSWVRASGGIAERSEEIVTKTLAQLLRGGPGNSAPLLMTTECDGWDGYLIDLGELS